MDTNAIVFKGGLDGLSILVSDGLSPDQFLQAVEEKIEANARFFRGARLKVTYKGIDLSADEEALLFKLLDERSGAVIESLKKAGVVVEKAATTPVAGKAGIVKPIRRYFSKDKDESDCKFIQSTLRGGTRVQYEGSVVVIGDVNPGAEVIATGNVIVLGLLRGMVHAGSAGSRDAFITALKLKPTQLRIADLIARCPDDPDTPGVFPEIASVKENAIVVNPLYERI